MTPFGFHSTARDVIDGIDLTGRHAIVTGGASGIGIETARALAGAGASVVLAVRRPEAAEPVAEGLRESTGNAAVSVASLDLADLHSVSAFARAWRGPLDILVNNAGIMAVPQREETAQGHELQLGTNFIGHFALTLWLHDALAAAQEARVVSLSSSGHLFSPVVFDDLHFRFIPYTPFGAYGQSKTANALVSVGITRRWQPWHHLERRQSRGDRHGPAETHRRLEDTRGAPQDSGAGSRNFGAHRVVAAGERCKRPILRGLQ
jgi:NAD(P)-dependent dehydrogenase (short-subunit alcohol dehydrogenase family)